MECHTWYGVNLGEMLVDKLLIERKKYPKGEPFNDLYKLCVNTVYGDMVSPFFTVGNVVVGNNITARARALAWCMEKGLHGWQSITDGCAFDLNRVLYPRTKHRITGEMAVNLYADNKSFNYTFTPLVNSHELPVTLNSDEIKLNLVDSKPCLKLRRGSETKQLTYEESLQWVNKAAMRHLQDIFPVIDILHNETCDVYGKKRLGQFEFEVKSFYDSATFHGSANYCLILNNEFKIGMRSYSKRGCKYVVMGDELEMSEDYEKPSLDFLLSLRTPHEIPRGSVSIKERILKIGDYRRNYKTWQDTDVYPGCTVEIPGLLHEFSLSQFTFQTYEQLKSWRREYERLLSNYGQSYEMFFLNDDGSLDYQTMVETVDIAIRAGKKNFFDGLDKRAANKYREYLKHQELDTLNQVRSHLTIRYHGVLITDSQSDDPSTFDGF